MKAIIDGDTIAFACAASAEDQDVFAACSRAQMMMENILAESGADTYEVWLTGEHNFRYKIYPEYKANRKDAYRPKWEAAAKDYMTREWNANWSEGCEADDMVGVRLMENKEAIACHIDKDIDTIPGWHYNWSLVRLGKVIRESKKYYIPPEQADYNFWYQLLVGDSTDNIKGASGIGPVKAKAILDGKSSNQEWYEAVKDHFSHEEEFEQNAQCIYIWRKLNDHWSSLMPPDFRQDGPLADFRDLSSEFLELGTKGGP